jgi:hypothetical protein
MVLRDLWKLKPAATALSLDEVERLDAVLKRFD